jgi:nucleotide-binding universal stress UspA family protein
VGSGRPLLIVPTGSASAETGPPLLGTVAIAWKDSAEAARAVGAATSLIGLAEQVLVLTVGEEPTAPDSTGQSVEADSARLVRTLQRHNPAVRAQHLPPGPDQPVEALLRAAVAAGAGLLVMGGYGHGRLREAVFGGFTQQVLRGAPMAVLMMH